MFEFLAPGDLPDAAPGDLSTPGIKNRIFCFCECVNLYSMEQPLLQIPEADIWEVKTLTTTTSRPQIMFQLIKTEMYAFNY